jgi:hypothetical protein
LLLLLLLLLLLNRLRHRRLALYVHRLRWRRDLHLRARRYAHTDDDRRNTAGLIASETGFAVPVAILGSARYERRAERRGVRSVRSHGAGSRVPTRALTRARTHMLVRARTSRRRMHSCTSAQQKRSHPCRRGMRPRNGRRGARGRAERARQYDSRAHVGLEFVGQLDHSSLRLSCARAVDMPMKWSPAVARRWMVGSEATRSSFVRRIGRCAAREESRAPYTARACCPIRSVMRTAVVALDGDPRWSSCSDRQDRRHSRCRPPPPLPATRSQTPPATAPLSY